MAKQKRKNQKPQTSDRAKNTKQRAQTKDTRSKKKRQTITRQVLRKNVKTRLLRICSQKKEQLTSQFRKKSGKLRQMILSEDIRCPICLEIMLLPLLTSCGHAYCLPCFEETLLHRNTCSICRQTIDCSEYTPSKILQKISNIAINKLSSELQESYKDRLQTFETEQRKRKVDSNCSVGNMVDFCQDWRWREGKIVKIQQANTQDKLIVVQSLENSNNFITFRLSSRLLAKHHHFTTNPFDIFQDSSYRILQLENPRIEPIENQFPIFTARQRLNIPVEDQDYQQLFLTFINFQQFESLDVENSNQNHQIQP